MRGKPPGAVEQVFFVLRWLFERIKAFAYDDVTGGAGAGLFAGVFDFDASIQQRSAQALSRFGFDDRALRAVFGVG